MAFLKKREFDEENRSFKKKWTQQYAFILPPSGSKPLCLICNECVALSKSSNLKRHYETKHRKFESMYQQKTEERKNKIDQLKFSHNFSQFHDSSRESHRMFLENCLDIGKTQEAFY